MSEQRRWQQRYDALIDEIGTKSGWRSHDELRRLAAHLYHNPPFKRALIEYALWDMTPTQISELMDDYQSSLPTEGDDE